MNVGQECARYSCNEEGDRHRCHIVCNRADACGPFQVARSAMAAIIETAQGPPQDVKEEKDALCNPDVVEGDANGEKGTNWDDKQSSRGVSEVLWRHLRIQQVVYPRNDPHQEKCCAGDHLRGS